METAGRQVQGGNVHAAIATTTNATRRDSSRSQNTKQRATSNEFRRSIMGRSTAYLAAS